MFILHVVGRSLVRLTPSRISCYWGRYTDHTSVAICLRRPGGAGKYREPLNPNGYEFLLQQKDRLQQLIKKADVIHCHDDAYPANLSTDRNKILIYHAHIGDIPRRLFKRQRFKYHSCVKHACITNGYGRHFEDESRRSNVRWGRLPDILDLDHPTYLPQYNLRVAPTTRVDVVFTYSNTRSPGAKINAKAPEETRRALMLPIEGVSVQMATGMSFEAAMNLKRSAHIVLDEIFSPYTHLSALEGASVGACVLTSYDDVTVRELCDYVGAPYNSYPFVRVTPGNARERIVHLRDNPDEMTQIGVRSREWMERYYNHRDLLSRYLEFYES